MAAQLQQIVLFDTAKADWRDIMTVIAKLQNCKVAKLQNCKIAILSETTVASTAEDGESHYAPSRTAPSVHM